MPLASHPQRDAITPQHPELRRLAKPHQSMTTFPRRELEEPEDDKRTFKEPKVTLQLTWCTCTMVYQNLSNICLVWPY
jgi:hypothetical protein